MENLVVLALAMATLGQTALCVPILLSRSFKTQAYLPLMLFFMAGGIIAALPAVAIFMPHLGPMFIALALPALLTLGPALWLYTEGLTAENAWRLQARHIWHFALVFLGLLVALLIAILPDEIRTTLFVDGSDARGVLPNVVVILFFLLIIGWLPQSTYYYFRIFRRLTQYRTRLKNLFASNEGRELQWLGWLVLILGSVWMVGFATIIADNFFDHRFLDGTIWAAIWFLLIWTMAIWGLRQKPGFEGRYLVSEADLNKDQSTEQLANQKYQRSALESEQAQRIAKKIDFAMRQDQLYLDPNLSLQKLSQHLGISSNFISQTLNQTIGQSFFDFVNRWRIEAAKAKIIADDATVLTIALSVGFNARSSFYKAFKRETGKTPRAYKLSNEKIDH